jgi:diacylglycerol kinase (ATP)
MELVIIVNPVAGSGAEAFRARRLAAVERLLADRGVRAGVWRAEQPGEVRRLAARAVAGGARLVVAWGGDGTVNEVGAALVGRDAALAIVPAGSGNGLARELGIDARPERAIVQALDGEERVVDAGELAGRVFFNVAGVGFDAHVAARFNARPPGRRGPWGYVALTVREAFRYTAGRYRVWLDGERHEGAFLTIVLANSCQFGNRVRIAPEARLDDGWLNAVLVDDRSLLRQFWRARHLLGDPSRAEGVLRRPVRELVVEGSPPMACQVDGESFLAGPRVEGRVHPGVLKVRVPRRCR